MPPHRNNADQFQLRLPPGLRDRIKNQAKLNGRSVNAEIVTVLEREFPEPVMDMQIFAEELSRIVKTIYGDIGIDEFVDAMSKTISGIRSGEISDVRSDVRMHILRGKIPSPGDQDAPPEVDFSHLEQITPKTKQHKPRK